MKRTWIAFSTLASLALLSAADATPAGAEAFVIVGGGLMVPLGDEDWTDIVESSPTFLARAGGGRKISARSRMMFEASFELTPLTTAYEDNDLFRFEANRFRVLLGGRLEQLVARGVLLAVRGGVGIDHLRGEVSVPALPGNPSEEETDTGLALELGIGPWFSAGSVLIGFELALPFALHDEDNLDFRTTDLELLAGVRFSL